MSEHAMDIQYAELAAHAVLGYLYDHDMYMLAEQFCLDCPYLKADPNTLERGSMPVNMLQKPLQQVMKEFIAMQSQFLQLVNLCSSVVSFPHTDSAMVLVDHLINVLQSSGTGTVLDAVISSLPAYNEWADSQSPPPSQPTPPAPDDVHNTTGSSYATTNILSSSFSSDSLYRQNGHTHETNDPSLIDRVVRFGNDPTPTETPTVVDKPPAATNQTAAMVRNSPIGGKRITPSTGKQSNLPGHSTGPAVQSPARQPNPLNHNPPVIVTLKPSQETELIATTNPPKVAIDPPKQPPSAEPVPPPALSGMDAPRSNATPLDNPIVPGTVSSRSTSSRKRTHIRILDFGTPPFKRNSPSGSSSAGRRPSSPPVASPSIRPPVPVLKFPPSADASHAERQRPTPSERPKPKKVPVKRRPKRLGVRKKSKRTNTTLITNKLVAETILKSKTLARKTQVPRAKDAPTLPCAPSTSDKPAKPTSPPKDEPASSSTKPQHHHHYVTKVPTTNEVPIVRPASSSPPRTLMPPGSPGCPVDPLTVYPMTPRFLTRPLQPLSMLSPLLGMLDMSGISQIKSVSHSKPSDINTPGYPITPGCTITPSPPPENEVTYYESRPPPPPDEREGGGGDVGAPAEDEASDSELADGGEGEVREPLLTLCASSDEISIQYRETGQCQLAPLRERDSEYDERLASRIEIDNGQQVFQIAISPIIDLFEHRAS